MALSFPVFADSFRGGINKVKTEDISDYSQNAKQFLTQAGGSSLNSTFKDMSLQLVLMAGDGFDIFSRYDEFSDNAIQKVFNGTVDHASFSGSAKQYVGAELFGKSI